MLTWKCTATFTEPLLGSAPSDPEVYKRFIQSQDSKRADAIAEQDGEETSTLPPESQEAKGWTVFHKDEVGLFLYDYAIKGAIKESANILKDAIGAKALKSKMDNYVFVFPRRVHILAGDGTPISKPDGIFERPLRAMTPMGPRVTLARSDMVNAGCKIDFQLKVVEPNPIPSIEKTLLACFEYWRFKGIGQFRNGGYGRCEVKMSE